MAELKTKQNDQSVIDFLNRVPDEKKRQDSFTILELFKQATGLEPMMWGDSIIGFGTYHYKYASGHEGDAPLTGFSPRKQNFSLYIMSGFDQYEALLSNLGKFKTGKVCLYINRVSDIDLQVLQNLVEQSVEHVRRTKL